MPEKYLVLVLSQPSKVSDEIWTKWYIEEHLRDMVYFNISSTGAFYRATCNLLSSHSNSQELQNADKTFLALYQAPMAQCYKAPEYKENVRLKSQLWDAELLCHDVGTFVPTNLQLTDTVGDSRNEKGAAPYLIKVAVKGDGGKDVDTWIRNHLVQSASTLPGFRRTVLYQPDDPGTIPSLDGALYAVALHEFDQSPDDVQQLRDQWDRSSTDLDVEFELRSYELLSMEGFEGKVCKPERL